MSHPQPPIELIVGAAKCLGDLCAQVTFLGGAVVPLLITDPAARSPRATTDVDVVIEMASLVEFYKFEKQLLDRGFKNAMEGPICRYINGLIILDVMPTDPNILGFANRWYPAAIRGADPYTLENGAKINLITSACFMATKLEAFDSPAREGNGDMFASRDFEDVVTILDGRESIGQDVLVAEPAICEYLRLRFTMLMGQPYWVEGIEAHVDQGRSSIVVERINSFVEP